MTTFRTVSRARAWLTAIAAGVIVITGSAYVLGGERANADTPLESGVRQLASQTSNEQWAILADGEVTEDEYVFAVNATRACLTSQGVVATEPEWQNGSMLFTFGSASTREELEEANATYQACYLTHQREIDRAWARAQAETAPAPKEIADLQACYEQHGVKFTRAAQDFHEVMNVIEAQGKQRVVGNCLNGREVQIGG